jgi:hypothetical protein
MEEVLLRFPHIGDQVFKKLDNEDLTKCRKISPSWNEFIDNQKLPWIRLMKKYLCELEFNKKIQEEWQTFVKSYNVATLCEIAIKVEHFFKNNPDEEYQVLDLLSAATLSSNIEIVEKLLENGADLEALNFDPLYYAAKQGDIVAYELLKKKCEDWSPTFFDSIQNGITVRFSKDFQRGTAYQLSF